MIALLGGTGYVGSAFVAFLSHRNVPYICISRTHGILRKQLRESKATFVINCAGFTGKPNVDACELDKQQCLEGNAVLPGRVKQVCDDLGIAWGHVSSGCIFTCDRGRDEGGNIQGFRETDPPNFSFRQNNCSFYSGTKALGEELLGYKEIRDANGNTTWGTSDNATGYIWRLRIPFHHRAFPRNYISKIMTYTQLLEARNSFSQLDEFVSACMECWELKLPFGIYNVTNPGSITTREVVSLIQSSAIGKRLMQQGKIFSYFKDEEEFMRLAAKSPRSNCILDNTKIVSAGIAMTPIAEAFETALFEWEDVCL